MSTVSKVTENSMSKAIEEIKALPNYRADGEVCMHNCFMYSVYNNYCSFTKIVGMH